MSEYLYKLNISLVTPKIKFFEWSNVEVVNRKKKKIKIKKTHRLSVANPFERIPFISFGFAYNLQLKNKLRITYYAHFFKTIT